MSASSTFDDAVAAADRAFCRELLPHVSRTFALSIEALPPSLREAIRVAYLLCRIVDTVEDEADLPAADRRRLFDAFDRLVDDDEVPTEAFEAHARAFDLAAGTTEGRLCRGAGAVFRVFRELPAFQRAAIRPPVLTMSRGMREYCERADESRGFQLRDLDDLERYCYFVAGTVGELLTALFEPEVPSLTEETREAVRDRSISFGLGLQLVNIVKDVATDFEQRGTCFLPVELAREEGLDLARLLDPTQREAGRRVIEALCKRARHHLRRASEYTRLWPTSDGVAVRLFCIVPLALALATLREVESGDDTLRRGRVPKVDRQLVARLVEASQRAAQSNPALDALLGRLEGPSSPPSP